jgi:phytoene synthase
MTFSTFHWEPQLISLAQEALDSYIPDDHSPPHSQALLDQAYHYAAQLTQYHSKTFYLASSLLSEDKRRAVRALYAFCRVSDDLVDSNVEDALIKLKSWRELTLEKEPTDQDAIAMAWNDTRRNYKIPWLYAEQLISGVAQDLDRTRYQTFDELVSYCYGVACTVGLMSMHIIGFSGPAAIPYAIRLGVALQMTNILRDIGDDWRNGRIYIPLEELQRFGLDEQAIADGRVDDRWRGFMRFQIERTRQLYAEALPGVSLLERDGRFAIEAAAELYEAILHDIEDHDYDVFNRRASVSKWGKVRRLPGIWWRANWTGNNNRSALRSQVS